MNIVQLLVIREYGGASYQHIGRDVTVSLDSFPWHVIIYVVVKNNLELRGILFPFVLDYIDVSRCAMKLQYAKTG